MMTLNNFVALWLHSAQIRPPQYPYEIAGSNSGVTLYRDEKFQVQLWICPPNTDISDHAHPNIDGWAIKVAGDIRFRKHGRPVGMHDIKIVTWGGMRTPMIRVGKDESHGVEIGPAGGSFLAVTERLDGTHPSSVHLDWCGKPLDDDHAEQLRRIA